MAPPISEMFERYNRKFDLAVGPLAPDQFGRWQNRLVCRLSAEEFEKRWREFEHWQEAYRAVIEAEATVTNELYDEVRTRAAELLMEESDGSFWW